MKKFLLTIAALFMVGTAFADNYLYIEDFEVTPEFLAQDKAKDRQMDVVVKAHFDHYVQAWQVWVTPSEGMENRNAVAGADMTLPGYDRIGNEVTRSTTLKMDDNVTNFIAAWDELDYYYPEGSDPDEDDPVSVGAVQWAPGDYDEMFIVTLRFAKEFTGGEILVATEPAGHADPRAEETIPKNEHFDRICKVTVAGGTEPIQTPAPEINVTAGDDAYIFEAVGEGVVTLFCDGVEVENPYTVARTEVDQIVKLTATAHVEGQTDGSVTGEYFVPALPVVVIPDLEGDVVISGPDENGVVNITYDGTEDVTIVVTVNGEEVTVVDGQITVGEGESVIVVTVTADGYNDLVVEETVTWTAPVTPTTDMPEISYETTDDAVIITVTGEGEIHVYVDGVEVENPYIIERGATDQVVVVTATAQADGMLISDVASMEITIPAVGGVEPEDPHDTGYWLVMLDKNGNEVWQYLDNTNPNDPNGYQANVALHYSQFGGKPVTGDMTDQDNPMVPFYFVVNGVRYSCEGENVEPNYGNANENPLFESENFWNVPVGYHYVIGIVIDPETGNYFMQISKGLYTGIDEMMGGKTVAGVRYFNMAGQEMQEANGMTIVVTTYTDGTTSAVKVMK